MDTHTQLLREVCSGQEEKKPGAYQAPCGAGQSGTIMVSKCTMGYGREKEADREVHMLEREIDESKEGKAVKNRLMWEACLLPG